MTAAQGDDEVMTDVCSAVQAWADTFISELNDTHIEADLRLRHTPPDLNAAEVVRAYACSRRQLIVLGYNATLTTAVEAPRQPKRHFDQIKALTRVNPKVLRCLQVRVQQCWVADS